MPRIPRASGSGPGRLSRARRTLLHYVATCKDCDAIPAGPGEATVHATAKGHTVVETKHYIVERP